MFKVGDKVTHCEDIDSNKRVGIINKVLSNGWFETVWPDLNNRTVDYPSNVLVPHASLNQDHYNKGSIECIDYLYDNMPRDAFIGYLEGAIKKYLHRWRYKEDPIKDLRKARDYLSVLIEVEQGNKPEFKEWKNE